MCSSGYHIAPYSFSLLAICTAKMEGFSVQFSRSVMSDSLWLHGLWHTRLPCPSPTLGACSNSCPLSRWCHPTISCSVVPFSSCLQSFPASGSFPMSQFFSSGGQSNGDSASIKLHSCFKKWKDSITKIKGRMDFWGHLAVCHLLTSFCSAILI